MKPLVIVGDALLDRDVLGTVTRVCPDAPVPVIDAVETRSRPGGAGLAALIAARTPRPVILITALAPDPAGEALASMLAGAGVEVVNLGLDGPTVEKVRIRAAGQSLLRVDTGGERSPVGPPGPEVAALLAGAAAIAVADYGRGVIAEPTLRRTLASVAATRPVVWDPHPRGERPVPGCWLVTPNAAEATTFAEAGIAGRDLGSQARRAADLRQRWEARAVAVTVGERGAVCVGPDGPAMVVPPPAAVPGDACGAGDAFLVSAAGAFADGAVLSEVVERAVSGAAAFVASGAAAAVSVPGPASWTSDRVGDSSPASAPSPGDGPRSAAGGLPGGEAATDPPGGAGEPAVGEDALALAERVRAAGGTVVATGGCFDLLHAGHVLLLRTARALGDCLIVLLNSDDSVRRLKGPDRPLQRSEDRAEVLAALGSVDAVLVFDEDTPEQALRLLRPHLFAKGGDYTGATLPEAAALEEWGGQAVVLPYLSGRSTTTIVQEAIRRARRP